ncbi:FadR/GntR family transcriptional regulator [Billgrantia gudaonensis]|uniref:GntR family transcriptional regulator, transcriptional repressor for pyruvate dehydrogenase complex n=1 Tax=Billgrantia gudaonensis TaxID=376427 RepID=A0A1G9DNB8_9GAMM|nr:FadR/GntR family transcriptional regulator [Halomonas gudaonensis]SDK65359.1 GntR family transcriptional regulator, transcriptional repressor for pyruvate dehydrogenase complex [Halomonas gudaonensis]
MKIEPLEKKSLSDDVVAKIKSMIVSGELKEGDRIPSERELCEQFGVSRASVREGLKILSLQGLLSRTNAGTVITTNFSSILEETLALKILLNDCSYDDVTEARLLLEITMVRLAAERIEPHDISIMAKQLDLMIKAEKEDDNDDYVLADIAFHQQIAKASQSRVLTSLYNAIITLVFRVQKTVGYDKPVMKESIKFHGKILEALKNNDAKLAEEEMRLHLLDVQKRLNHLVKKDTIKGGV